MAIYFMLLLVGSAPAVEPVIARDIHARPVPLAETTKGLIEDRPALGYVLAYDEADPASRPRLAYDIAGLDGWDGRREREEAAFEEAIDMARDARLDLGAEAAGAREPD